jgi:hypothetical protein
MGPAQGPDRRRFRVWIVRYDGWQPQNAQDTPPTAVALEPAENGTMTRPQAQAYTEAFNRAMLAAGRSLWALALPVAVCYQGEPQAGQVLERAEDPS